MSTAAESTKDLRYLMLAIYNFLIADSDLVALMDHSSSNYRIFSGTPDMMAKYPCVCFWDENTVSVVDRIDEYRQTIINFAIIVGRGDFITFKTEEIRDRIYCDVIAGRIQRIFQPGTLVGPDLSDSQVQINNAIVLSRLNTRLEDEIDVWRTDVVVVMDWYFKS